MIPAFYRVSVFTAERFNRMNVKTSLFRDVIWTNRQAGNNESRMWKDESKWICCFHSDQSRTRSFALFPPLRQNGADRWWMMRLCVGVSRSAAFQRTWRFFMFKILILDGILNIFYGFILFCGIIKSRFTETNKRSPDKTRTNPELQLSFCGGNWRDAHFRINLFCNTLCLKIQQILGNIKHKLLTDGETVTLIVK